MNRRLDVSTLAWLALLAAFFGLFLAYPIAYVVKGAFWPHGAFSLEYFALLLRSPLFLQCTLNSLLIGGVVTLLCTLIALPLAHWFSRYSLRGKPWLNAALLAPMILPPFVGAIGIKQLFSRYGSANLLLMKLGLIIEQNPIDWLGGGGFWGVAILEALHLYPILFLNLTAAIANIDPTLREAAENLGARGWRLFRTITLPLALPGYFAGAILVFIFALTDLGTPLIFGFYRVLPVQIFDKVTETATNPMGFALVMVLLSLSGGLFLVSKKFFGNQRYEMISRGGHTTGELPVRGRHAVVIYGFTFAVLALALLPHASVIVSSFAGRWFFSVLPSEWTIAHFGEVFQHKLTLSSIRNSLLYSSLSASLDLMLGVLIAWLITRKLKRGAWLLDSIAMSPLVLPGIVLAFGYVAGFDWKISWINPRENPTLLLVISYAVRRLPYIVRAAVAGFQQSSVTLEEASANLGASTFTTLRRITVPLVMANLVAGSILTFSFAMLEVSDSLVLAMKQNFYPITKAIYHLLGRIEPNAPAVSCAMGTLGMLLLWVSLLSASKILGKKMGALFRA